MAKKKEEIDASEKLRQKYVIKTTGLYLVADSVSAEFDEDVPTREILE